MDALRIGKISSINYTAGTARVLYEDRDNAVTVELPYLTDYRTPKIDDLVLVSHLPNGPSAGVILGPFWNDGERPPEGASGLYRKDFDNTPGNAFLRYDAATGTLKILAPNIEFAGSSGALKITAPSVDFTGSGGGVKITQSEVSLKSGGSSVNISGSGIAFDGEVSGIGEGEGGGGGMPAFETDETLTLENGVLSVNTADVVEADNTLPITSAAVQVAVGNIDALLQTI